MLQPLDPHPPRPQRPQHCTNLPLILIGFPKDELPCYPSDNLLGGSSLCSLSILFSGFLLYVALGFFWSACLLARLALCLDLLSFLFRCSLEGTNDLYILLPILDLPESARSISLSVVIGWVVLMVVWCCCVEDRTVLLMIMLNCWSNSPVSCANKILK